MARHLEALHRPLASARVYSLVQRALGAQRVRRHVLAEHLLPLAGDRILDLGCGPGDILALLPRGVGYTGVDSDDAYLAAARQRCGGRHASFIRGDVRELDVPPQSFDAVIAVGLLHHLDDRDASRVLGLAAAALVPAGRLVTVDPAIARGQPRLARWLAERDRGRWPRAPGRLEAMSHEWFDQVEVCVRHDLARVPYTHVIVVARRPKPGG